MNESIGGAFLLACRDDATGPLPRAALQELLRDEVDHARIDWGFLTALEASRRDAIAPHLPGVVDMVRDAWLQRASLLPDAVPLGHGCLPGPRVRTVVTDAIDNLIVPGFRAAGLPAPGA